MSTRILRQRRTRFLPRISLAGAFSRLVEWDLTRRHARSVDHLTDLQLRDVGMTRDDARLSAKHTRRYANERFWERRW